jgi:hypothetical protein
MKTKFLVVAVVLLTVLAPSAAQAADGFYAARLQDGRLAFQTGSPAEAADLLRVACFGLMDQPELLSEGLVWLVLAQQKLGRGPETDATLRRFLDVEKRFGVYPKVVLPAETRKAFEAVLAARVPPDALRSVSR